MRRQFRAAQHPFLSFRMAPGRRQGGPTWRQEETLMSERTLAEAISRERVVTTTKEASVLEAAQAMAAAGCGSALVVDAAGRLEGIATERDVMVRCVAKDLAPRDTAVGTIMSTKLYCAKPDMPVTHALLVMKDMGFRHIPVLDPQGTPLGVFSIRDALPGEVSGADELLDTCLRISETIA
jgi:CBS domain-containing protein